MNDFNPFKMSDVQRTISDEMHLLGLYEKESHGLRNLLPLPKQMVSELKFILLSQIVGYHYYFVTKNLSFQ